MSLWKRYAAFLRAPPEITVSWCDGETGARAWLVINSSRGGAAGGGTRMRAGTGMREVVYLAKAMELKFAISGPAIGGAKTGIDFDPSDPRRTDVLERWFTAIAPLLRERYGTGGDLNIDEVMDVLPAFARLGLQHPQEGIVRGHVQPDAGTFQQIMRRMDEGVSASVPAHLGMEGSHDTVADLATGLGLAAAIRHFQARHDRPMDGVRVKIEGFGNVGAACALYLARAGARIVALSDVRHTFVEPDGLDAVGTEDLIRRRAFKMLPADDPRVITGTARDAFHDAPADVFVCAAISQSVSGATLDRLEAAGVRVIACGANQPFREVRIGSTRVAQAADRRFAVLADILSNCGMARTFSYLMEPDCVPCAENVFEAIDGTITETLDDVLDRVNGRPRALLAATLGLALDRIGAA